MSRRGERISDRRGDRRTAFFLVAAVACLLLAPVAPGEYVGICIAVAATYVVLAGLTALDRWSRNRSAERLLQDRS